MNTPFESIIIRYQQFDFDSFFASVNPAQVNAVLNKNTLNISDFMILLSDSAKAFLEEMSQKSRALTIQHFGKTVQLYTPLYISNYCSNECIYCGFRKTSTLPRKKLSPDELKKEAEIIFATGVQNILVLTGERCSPQDMDFLLESVRFLKTMFSSVGIETFPMETTEYTLLKNAGADLVTVYQETYNKEIYDKIHVSGRKKDYLYRLNTPERAAKAGIRSVNIGALLGLAPKKEDVFFTALHAHYLQNRFIDTDISVSLPRITSLNSFSAPHTVTETDVAQFIAALRLLLPKAGIIVSTRESTRFRNNIIPLGVTRISAGSKTSVGGYSGETDAEQFEIHDSRTVDEISRYLDKSGYQPVLKDWENAL